MTSLMVSPCQQPPCHGLEWAAIIGGSYVTSMHLHIVGDAHCDHHQPVGHIEFLCLQC